jgi:hypothetical protein
LRAATALSENAFLQTAIVRQIEGNLHGSRLRGYKLWRFDETKREVIAYSPLTQPVLLAVACGCLKKAALSTSVKKHRRQGQPVFV